MYSACPRCSKEAGDKGLALSHQIRFLSPESGRGAVPIGPSPWPPPKPAVAPVLTVPLPKGPFPLSVERESRGLGSRARGWGLGSARRGSANEKGGRSGWRGEGGAAGARRQEGAGRRGPEPEGRAPH